MKSLLAKCEALIGYIYLRIFSKPMPNIFKEFYRSIIVAFIALFVDFGLLIFLTEIAGLHYLVSASIGFICGLITNYILSVMWVFKARKLGSKTHEFVIFSSIGIVGLVLNNLLLWFVTEKLNIDYRIAKSVAVLVVFLWNFGMRKFILY